MSRLVGLIRCAIFKVIYHNYFSYRGFPNIPISVEIRAMNGGKIILGNSVSCQKRVALVAAKGTLIIGQGVSLNRNCIIICHQKVNIGAHCAFGPNVVIYDHDHKFDYLGFTADEYNTSPVEIGDNCWIGANVTILRGTTIGEGSVIGAGTIVKGVIPPHSLVTSDRGMIVKPIEEQK